MDRRLFGGAAICGAVIAMLASWPAVASAQLRAGAVQLPTFNFFTVNTSIEVPDGGDGALGGVGSSSTGRNERGFPGLGFRPFNNVGVGAARGAGNMSVHAEVHDFDATDRQLLGDDFNKTAGSVSGPEALAIQRLPVMLRPVAGAKPKAAAVLATDSSGGQSIADLRRQQADEDSAAQQEAQRLFDQASELQAAGKPGVAKVYFQMAARRATGALKDRALAAIRDLSRPTQSASADR